MERSRYSNSFFFFLCLVCLFPFVLDLAIVSPLILFLTFFLFLPFIKDRAVWNFEAREDLRIRSTISKVVNGNGMVEAVLKTIWMGESFGFRGKLRNSHIEGLVHLGVKRVAHLEKSLVASVLLVDLPYLFDFPVKLWRRQKRFLWLFLAVIDRFFGKIPDGVALTVFSCSVKEGHVTCLLHLLQGKFRWLFDPVAEGFSQFWCVVVI